MIGCRVRCCSLADGNAEIPTGAENPINPHNPTFMEDFTIPSTFIKGNGMLVDSDPISDTQGIFQMADNQFIPQTTFNVYLPG